MIKLRNLVEIMFGDSEIHHDMEKVMERVKEEWRSGQKHQSWRLVPKRLLNVVWNTYIKYGRVHEKGLEKIWEIVKECTLKIIFNSEIHHGIWDDVFFNVEGGEKIPEKVLNKWAIFISDRSKHGNFSRSDVDATLPSGYGRYSDKHNQLFKLLETAYNAETSEKRLLAIDQILNFVHGIGYMADWFVEGGESSLSNIRDQDIKGIHLKGKLSEGSLADGRRH